MSLFVGTLLLFCSVPACFSINGSLFLLIVLVVVHLSERLRFSFSVLVFSFRIVVVVFVLGLFVRLMLSRFVTFRKLGFSLLVLFVPLWFVTVSVTGLCAFPSCTPSFSAVGLPGLVFPFVCSLRARLLDRSFVSKPGECSGGGCPTETTTPPTPKS